MKKQKKEGYGILYKGGKIIYQGEWKDDHKEGKGIMYYANKSRYEGQWEKDKKTEKDTKESMKMIV